jgi:hypothetical protein
MKQVYKHLDKKIHTERKFKIRYQKYDKMHTIVPSFPAAVTSTPAKDGIHKSHFKGSLTRDFRVQVFS